MSASILLATAGGAAAAMRLDASRRNEMFQGISVGGVQVGGLTFADARVVLEDAYVKPLDRVLLVEVGDRTFSTTPKELGFKTNVLSQYRLARDLGSSLPFFPRVWHRITGKPYGMKLSVKTSVDSEELEGFIEEIARDVDRPAEDAIPKLEGGSLLISDGREGFVLNQKLAFEAIVRTTKAGGSRVFLSGEELQPAVTRESITDVLVVKTGENKLYHYRGDAVVKVYDVATGTSRYPTPRGTFKIVNKRFRPTWVNPAKYPGGWGWRLPARIGPGPGNPLGTRALDLNSPGIRIHGTYASHSIGYNASHGCIRMRIADVEELFGLVSVGTPVIIAQTAPFRSIPAPPPTEPEPTAESDGTQVPGQQEPPGETSPSPGPAPTPPGA